MCSAKPTGDRAGRDSLAGKGALRVQDRRNFSRHKTLTMMDYESQERRLPTKQEREAKKAKARKEAEQNLIARKKSDDAFRANFERLKAERIARQKGS